MLGGFYSEANITGFLKNKIKWAELSFIVAVVIVQVLSCFPNPAEFWIRMLYFSEVNLWRRRIRAHLLLRTRRCTSVAVTIVKLLEDQLLNEYSLFYRKSFFLGILSYWRSASMSELEGEVLCFYLKCFLFDFVFWCWHSVMNNIWSLVSLIALAWRRLLSSYCRLFLQELSNLGDWALDRA